MLYTLAYNIWNITKWITGLIIAFLIGYMANIAVLQIKDIPSTFLVSFVNWLFLPGFNRTLTLGILIPLFMITLLAGAIQARGNHEKKDKDRPQKTTPSPYPKQSIQNRQRMLAKVRAFWITGVLEQSLHSAALIALGLHEQSGAVANPWRLVLQESDESARALPPDTSITQVYNDAGCELLILGEPGSGKTTLLLELARDLLDNAQQDEAHPMPVVFNLSSWAVNRQPITRWLIEELNSKYQVPYKLGQSWVDGDQLLLLLDGLDEVPPKYRTACIDAINTYREGHGLVPMVVCSRKTDYLAQNTRLMLRSAVVVQPLTAQQIDDYLSSAGGQLAAVRVALRDDPVMQELATTPLILSVLTLAYHGKRVEDLLMEGSFTTRRRQVFKTYVQRMLQRRGSESRYTVPETMHWLAWLARELLHHSQTEFYIERMQPDWLPNSHLRWLYRCIFPTLVFGLFGALFGGLVAGLVVEPLFGLVVGLVVGLLFGLVVGMFTEIRLAEVVIWSLMSMRRSLVVGLTFGLTGGLVGGLIGGLFGGQFSEIVGGLFGGLVGGLVGLKKFGLPGERLDEHNLITPNQGIWRSLRNGALVGLLFGLIGGLACVPAFGLLFGLVFGLLFGLVSGLFSGGSAFFLHVVLRLLLWRAACTPSPLNYIRFLDYAVERILLRKVGGGYIFVHRLLLEYFATLDTMSLPDGVAESLQDVAPVNYGPLTDRANT